MHNNGVAFHIKGVFVGNDLYYVGVFSNKFYKDQTGPALDLSYIQAVLYTSDMSLTSCYSMPSNPPSAPISMTSILFSGSVVGSSIYDPVVPVTGHLFNEDHAAYLTVDIV